MKELVTYCLFKWRQIQAMKKQGGGVILNVASAAGFLPASFSPLYSASKGLWHVNAIFLVAISFLWKDFAWEPLICMCVCCISSNAQRKVLSHVL